MNPATNSPEDSPPPAINSARWWLQRQFTPEEVEADKARKPYQPNLELERRLMDAFVDPELLAIHRKLALPDWLKRDIPPRDWLVDQVIAADSRSMLFATTGLGKTHLGMALAGHIAAGEDFLHWRIPEPRRVLYIDGEMPEGLAKERLQEMVNRLPDQEVPEDFYYFNMADFPDFQPLNKRVPDGNLGWLHPGQLLIEKLIDALDGVDLVIFDNFQSLTAGNMKDTEIWGEIAPWAVRLTNKLIAQLWIHHANESGDMYGDKTKGWGLDNVIRLQRVDDADEEIAFTLDFTKSRQRTPKNRDAYRAVTIRLTEQEGWTWQAAIGTGKVRPRDIEQVLRSNNAFYDPKTNQGGMDTRGLAIALLQLEGDDTPCGDAIDARVHLLNKRALSPGYKPFVVRGGSGRGRGAKRVWGVEKVAYELPGV